MTTVTRLVSALAITFFALAVNVRAQTPSIEVTTDEDAAQFSTQGKAQAVRVEVYAPSGELVFEGDGLDGQGVLWRMRNQNGERVADGVYLATITVTDAAGRKRKRIEQVTVSSEPPQASTPAADASAPQDSLAPTGAGTAGKVAKWTTSSNLGNSVITESAGKVGVNIAPTATLQANGLQPPALATTGTTAPVLLQTSGGKGGNTTGTTGQLAGTGASISLVAGNGGDAPAGSKKGKGGNITLQPGSGGAGAGTAAASGNVLLAPSGVGNVGVGTNAPASRLTVNGVIQTTGAGGGIKFPDNSVQTKAANISGAGTTDQLAKFTGANSFGNSTITESGGYVGIGIGIGPSDPQARLHVVSEENIPAVYARSTHDGLVGISTGAQAYGVLAKNFGGGRAGAFVGSVLVSGNLDVSPPYGANFGATPRQMLNLFNASHGIGVQNFALYFRTDYNFNWYRGGVHDNGDTNPGSGGTIVMRLDSSGNLSTKGAVNPSSDRNLKSNFSAVNPRFILGRLAEVPIQTWNYKSESEAVRHLGPVAQDFRAAFNLGADDKHISTVDADGVALASIQALYQLMLEKDRQIARQGRLIEQQSKQMAQFRSQLQGQQAQLDRVRRAVRAKRAARR